jgi:hypothetical protein
MAVVKISVSVDESVLTEARRFVGSRELSTYVNEALEAQNRRRAALGLLTDLDRQFGVIANDDPEATRAKKVWQEYVSSSTPAPSPRSRGATFLRARSSKKR